MAEVRVKCPYCKRVFLWKKKPVKDGQISVALNCPYCKEQLVLTKEMMAKSY